MNLRLLRNTFLGLSLAGFGGIFGTIAYNGYPLGILWGSLLGGFLYFYITLKEIKK